MVEVKNIYRSWEGARRERKRLRTVERENLTERTRSHRAWREIELRLEEKLPLKKTRPHKV